MLVTVCATVRLNHLVVRTLTGRTRMDRRTFLAGSTTAGVAALAGAAPAAADLLAAAPPQPASFGAVGRNFPKVCGNYGNQNHSPLRQVTRSNVRRLGG